MPIQQMLDDKQRQKAFESRKNNSSCALAVFLEGVCFFGLFIEN